MYRRYPIYYLQLRTDRYPYVANGPTVLIRTHLNIYFCTRFLPPFIVQHIDWAPCLNDYSFYLDCCPQFWPALTGLNQPLLFKPALQFQPSCYLNALFEPTIQPSGALHLVYLSHEASSSFLSYFKAKWMRKFVTG